MIYNITPMHFQGLMGCKCWACRRDRQLREMASMSCEWIIWDITPLPLWVRGIDEMERLSNDEWEG